MEEEDEAEAEEEEEEELSLETGMTYDAYINHDFQTKDRLIMTFSFVCLMIYYFVMAYYKGQTKYQTWKFFRPKNADKNLNNNRRASQ